MPAIIPAAERRSRTLPFPWQRMSGPNGLIRRAITLGALASVLVTAPGCAADAEGDAKQRSLREHLEREYPNLSIDAVEPTPLDGVYEVVAGTRVLYVSEDGRYFLRGNLIDLQTERDLTEERRTSLVHNAVDAVGEDRMLVYEPDDESAERTITVFTDTSCAYCQRLHEELLSMMERHPVRVRYLLFPRAGIDAGAADTMRDVWCAPDPHAALTAAKRGESVPARDADCTTPIKEHYELGQRIGVKGTPYMLVGDDGPAVPGYRPTDQLLSMLGLSS